jgi:hypothetical protein
MASEVTRSEPRRLVIGGPSVQKFRPLSAVLPMSAARSRHIPPHSFNIRPKNLKMSLAGPLPLRVVAPIRAVSASQPLCQRRRISQSTRAQPQRPALTARRRQNAPPIRIRVRNPLICQSELSTDSSFSTSTLHPPTPQYPTPTKPSVSTRMHPQPR